MTAKKEDVSKESDKDSEVNDTPDQKKKCFVIMPIADQLGYPEGHFSRVYQELIKPAVEDAGFSPERADDSVNTKVIILSILKAITEHDMAICDLSALNPNVMYELGIRQMAKMPVTLIKDKETRRIFDIGLMSDVWYDSSLRVDLVRDARKRITAALISTYKEKDSNENSLLKLLGTELKIEKNTLVVSSGEKIIMDQLKDMLTRFPTSSSKIHVTGKNIPAPLDANSSVIHVNSIVGFNISSPSKNDVHYLVKEIVYDEYESTYEIECTSLMGMELSATFNVQSPVTELKVISPTKLKILDPQAYANYLRETNT